MVEQDCEAELERVREELKLAKKELKQVRYGLSCSCRVNTICISIYTG